MPRAEKSRQVYAFGNRVTRDAMPNSSGKTECAALLSFPKRYLSPLRRACLSLGLEVDARPETNLAWLLRTAAGLRTTAIIEYLKFCKDEEARRIVELHSVLNATERKAVTIDYLVIAAAADIHHVLGLILEGASRIAEVETVLTVCTNAPHITRKAVKFALTPDGDADRELILQILGVVPLRTAGTPRVMLRYTQRLVTPN